MNARLVFLSASLVANIALGLHLASRPPAPAPAGNRTSAQPGSPAATATAAQSQPAQSGLDQQTWDRLTRGTDTEFAAHLRTDGFPPEVVRALVSQRIRARYAERFRALQPPDQNNYWRRNNGGPSAHLSPEARAQRRALEREVNDAVKLALGPDAARKDTDIERNYGPLPREKVAQLEAVLSDYREMSAQVTDRAGGTLLPEDREQLRLLERERRADLAALLNPAELLEYDLRSSSSAMTVRNRLLHFDATEAEYRALVSLQLDFDSQYPSGNMSRAERTRRFAAEKDLAAKVQTVLTPERFADYQIVTDTAFRMTADSLQSFNYDAAVTKQVVAVQRSIADQRRELVRQFRSDPAQQVAALENLRQSALAKLSASLSPQALEAYMKSSSGRWLLPQGNSTPPGAGKP